MADEGLKPRVGVVSDERLEDPNMDTQKGRPVTFRVRLNDELDEEKAREVAAVLQGKLFLDPAVVSVDMDLQPDGFQR